METTSVNGIIYDINKLRVFAESLPIVRVKTNLFQEAISPKHKYWVDTQGQHLGPSDLLANWSTAKNLPQFKPHIDSIARADLSSPIWVLTSTHQVIDGMHRLTKAFLDNHQTILVRYLDTLPQEARADKD